MKMEIAISIGLGIWVMIAGIVRYIHMKNDDKREGTK